MAVNPVDFKLMRPAKEIPLTAVCGRALLADLPYSSA
jgi:hypothetical protein